MRSMRAPASPYWANSDRAAARIVSRSSVVVRTARSYQYELVRLVCWLGHPPNQAEVAVNEPIDIDAVMSHPRRVQFLRGALEKVHDGIAPLIDLWRPYVSGLEHLPADGRFLLVGNHTQFIGGEVLLVPHFVRRALGRRVRPLADRRFATKPGFGHDVMTAYGARADVAQRDHPGVPRRGPRDSEVQGRGIPAELAGAFRLRPHRGGERLSDRPRRPGRWRRRLQEP